jgi:putative Mn2+ efflux pump MntP
MSWFNSTFKKQDGVIKTQHLAQYRNQWWATVNTVVSSFLTSAIGTGKWSVSRLDRFTSAKKKKPTALIFSRVGAIQIRSGHFEEKKTSFLPPEIDISFHRYPSLRQIGVPTELSRRKVKVCLCFLPRHIFGPVRKIATISFVMSVRLIVRPSVLMEQLGSHWSDFHENWYLKIFRKSV